MRRASQRIRPARARESRQGLPHAAPLRRGARPVPRPPARAGGPCRALLSRAIVEHEPGDLTCVVAGGLRLSALQAALAEHGQRLSLDPPGDPTLGECLLEDLSGPLRHRFGTMRDLVIGVTVTLPDGTRASSGGKVVKNVAGYDLGKLFCGSRGRLGASSASRCGCIPCRPPRAPS